MIPSQRVRSLEPSATIAVNNLRLRLEAEGRRVYNFSVGEPDFDTPEFVRRAAADAAEKGWTRYTPAAGVPRLRQAVAAHVGALRGESITEHEVLVTCGAKHACANVILGLVDPGDEVLLPAPYWVSYPEMIRLAEGIAVVAGGPRERGYRVTPEMLEPLVTPRTTGLILNSPSNPTGCVYNRADVDALVDFAADHDLWILSDEIYDQFIFEGALASPFSGKGRGRTLLVGGVSKTYAMTGWRIGWVIGDREIISTLNRLQEHTTSNATAVSQAAAIAALEAPPERSVLPMLAEFRRRRDLALRRLATIPRLRFFPPEGAFYVFLELGEILGRDGYPPTPAQLCTELLDREGVALVPGEGFGAPKAARLSYACSTADLDAGLSALARYLTR